MNSEKNLWMFLRLFMGFIFFWAFVDKTFGLGFATKAGASWVKGFSPTYGFLTMATKGPFGDLFKSLAGVQLVDWLFMLGLLLVGVTLLSNKYVFWGSIAGIAMLALMYLAALWPANNPILDDHIIYILVLSLLAIRSRRSGLA